MKQSDNNNDNDKILLETINQKLDAGLDAMDDETKETLRTIRLSAQAQAKHEGNKSWQWFRPWLRPMPIMLAASLVVVLSVSLRINMTPSIENTLAFESTPALEDMPLLTAADGIEFYDDLEFYQWLEATQYNG